jgi:hypothetical protein
MKTECAAKGPLFASKTVELFHEHIHRIARCQGRIVSRSKNKLYFLCMLYFLLAFVSGAAVPRGPWLDGLDD